MSPRTSYTVGGAVGRFAPDPAGLQERIVERARADPAIHGLILLGSRARVDHPADEWSDTDLVVVVDEPDAFLADAGWPSHLGTVAMTFLEPTLGGRRERRVLFADGTDLDLVPIGAEEIASEAIARTAAPILARGYRVLLDKDGTLEALIQRLLERHRLDEEEWPPSLVDFENLVADFWYHAVWTARKLRRGELWVALDCLDGYMKRRLLTIIEWQARARGDGRADVWPDGRFLERWTDADTLEGLRHGFARYEAMDAARALRGSMDLFRYLATDLSVRLELPYPQRADEAADRIVRELLD